MRISEIKKQAKERFAAYRYQTMLTYGVVYVIALNIAVMTMLLWVANKWSIGYGILLIAAFLIMLAPLSYGMAGFYLKLYKYESGNPTIALEGFVRSNLGRAIALALLRFALWLAFTLLLVVPGIIFAIRTSMATNILRANPKLRPVDALKASNRVMKSHSMHYFALMSSFTGWFLLGLVTCFAGFMWVLPYVNLAKIVFYKRELQGDNKAYESAPVQKPVEAKKPAAPISPRASAEESKRDFFADEKIEVETVGEVAPVTDDDKRRLGLDFMSSHEMTPDEREREDMFFYGSERIEVEEYDESAELSPQPVEEAVGQVEPIIETMEESAPEQVLSVEEVPETVTDQPPSIEVAEQSVADPVEIDDLGELTDVSSEIDPQSESIEIGPLPGGNVIVTEDGSRVVDRPTVSGSEPPSREKSRVEISEQGETIQQRLMRLRAERAAKMGQKGDAPIKKNNVEIGED